KELDYCAVVSSDGKPDPTFPENAPKGSPAVRLGVEDAERFELAADVGLAFRAPGRQRRPRGADRASHDHHAALERGGVLIAEQRPQPRHLVLQLARARPVAGDAGFE